MIASIISMMMRVRKLALVFMLHPAVDSNNRKTRA